MNKNIIKNPLIATACLGALLLASCGSGTEAKTEEKVDAKEAAVTKAETFKLNTEQSVVNWEGNMVGLYAHSGTIKFSEGQLTVNGNMVTGGSFTIDMGSITPTDANFKPDEGKTPDKLVGHLSSPDFFDVASFPNAVGKIVAVDGTDAKVELTIRGKTDTEAMTINQVSTAGGTVKASGTLAFDRQKYGVAFKHPMKEMVVADQIKLNIELVANK